MLRVIGGTFTGSVAWRLPQLSQSEGSEPRPESVAQTGLAIRLNRNESAYGPSEKALEAIRAGFSSANRYPSSEYESLTESIASFHRVKPERIVLGAGSREVLRMAASAYLSRGRSLVIATPTYDPVARFAEVQGAAIKAVPLNKRHEHDLDSMLSRIDPSSGLVYICNPNNPTGTITPRKDLEIFLSKVPSNTAVLIDEAYHEYLAKSSDYCFIYRFTDYPRTTDRCSHLLENLRSGGIESRVLSRFAESRARTPRQPVAVGSKRS